MRIGILTLPLHTNYGGILQAYALQTVLQRMGHDASVIEKERKPLHLPLWRMPIKYGRRIVKNLTGNPCPILLEKKLNRELPLIRQHTDRFIDKHIRLHFVSDYAAISRDDFDAITVGSDQVWRPQYFDDATTPYLGFAEGWPIRRIAYAASFGTDAWEYSKRQEERCKRLIGAFNAVSVRESTGVTLCREHFGVEARHVLDPTMLLGKDDYISLSADTQTPKSSGTLLNYTLDETPQKAAIVNAIARRNGLVPFRVNSRVEDINAPLSERVQPPVEQWLRGFYDAKFVVTDSFHACVFSIIFNKPFIAIGNPSRGMSRFKSLLAMFGLEDRLVTSGENTTSATIDYGKANLRLAEMREKSMEFLIDAITK